MSDNHLESLSSTEIMMLRYRRDVSLKELTRLKAPERIIEHATGMLERVTEVMSKRGITEDQYKSFESQYWTVFAADQMNQDMKGKCLVWMIHCREYMDKDYYDPAECTMRNKTCGPFCNEWVEATEEQQARYYHHLDLDTGEPLPLMEDMNELFDEDHSGEGDVK